MGSKFQKGWRKTQFQDVKYSSKILLSFMKLGKRSYDRGGLIVIGVPEELCNIREQVIIYHFWQKV